MKISERKDLGRFIVKATRAAYAKGAEWANLLRGGAQFRHTAGRLTYWHTLWHYNPFVGQIMVWSQDVGWVWAMNYYGWLVELKKGLTIEDNPKWVTDNAEKIFKFRESALKHACIRTPYRGPRRYISHSGDFLYDFNEETESDIEHFSGDEEIYSAHFCVYRGHFHGGLIGAKPL